MLEVLRRRRERQRYGRNQRKRNSCAVCDSAGWHEPKSLCDRQCRKEGFKIYEIAGIMVEDDGKRNTINLCKECYNSKQAERKEPEVSGERWRIMVGGKKLSGQTIGLLRGRGIQT